MLDSLFHFHSQPAFRAASDTLNALGYSRSHVRRDFEIAVSAKEPRWSVDAVAFSNPVAHVENACVTVLNLASTGLDRTCVAERLRRTTAPFHLVYDDRRGFDIWADGKPEVVTLAEGVAPDRLFEAVREYSADFQPATVQRVKRGLSSFAHEKLAELQPLQGLLWAEEANCYLLAAHFRHALDELKKAGISDALIQNRLAAQLLTSRILADTGAMESCEKVKEIPVAAEKKKFVDYFDAKLLRQMAGPAQQAYDLFRRISFATFQPEMLRTLYKSLYTEEESRAKGRFDTPLWLTRRIWREIPIEFLPPDQRVVMDLTCGWGSFLVSAVERFSELPDMGSRRLSHYIFGNDNDQTTAELARVALLTSTGRDSWRVDHEDGRVWDLPQRKKPGVIVGNPPFAGDRKLQSSESTGGRRQELANDFLQRAVNALADGGYLAMIMPGSFVASESGPEVRKTLLERCDIQEIWEIPGKIFEAGVQPIVLFARKEKGKQTPSKQPVRTRICQNSRSHITALKQNGVFTRSEVFPDQSRWIGGRRTGKTTHVFEYTSLLSDAEWGAISAKCVTLADVATVFTGCTKGSPEKVRTKWDEPRKVRLLVKAGSTLPSEFIINDALAENASYPNDFKEPCLPSLSILEGQKILLLSDPDPSWGKRVKLAIERRGHFPSDGFLVITPNDHYARLGLEALASVIRWKVGNAWVAEHLKFRKINADILRRLPIPKSLLSNQEIVRRLKTLLLRIERAAIAGEVDADSESEMDLVLRKAYAVSEDSVWERLCAVYSWDEIGDQTPSFDPSAMNSRTDWSVEGAVEAVDLVRSTLTLWLSGFDNLQSVPLCPRFPGWMLRPGVKFRTTIPSSEARIGHVSGTVWGIFEPANYTYLSVEQMAARMNAVLKRRCV